MPTGLTAYRDTRCARFDARNPVADALDQLAGRLQDVAEEMRRKPGRPHAVTERLINEVEDVAASARRTVRG